MGMSQPTEGEQCGQKETLPRERRMCKGPQA